MLTVTIDEEKVVLVDINKAIQVVFIFIARGAPISSIIDIGAQGVICEKGGVE